ncbi:hypothetical protein GOP47_0027133 [Adiantum capillus-veneris]|nr:hypothetical protein GOP47_0027133 [Adiantum capillus-veneris]
MQAHELPAVNAVLVTILILVLSNGIMMDMRAMAGITEDRDALIEFIKSADPRGLMASNWSGSNPCADAYAWDGVKCNKGRVWNVILETKQLGGHISRDGGLAKLDQLRKISLKNNMLSGSVPSFKSPFLRCIWLSNNSLSGSIPDIFSHTRRFNKLDVSHNTLTGKIPSSLTSIVKLNTLLLDDNQLTGSIPPLNQGTLATFNVSNNRLSGRIPSTFKLQSFVADSYMNNQNLCGPPLSLLCKRKQAMSTVLKILLIVAVDVVVLCFMSLLAVYCYKRLQRKKKASAFKGGKEPVKASDSSIMSMEETGTTYDKASRNEEMTDAEKSKLVVFDRPGRLSFDLEELLQASAEMLGKGSFGTAYKALFGGPNGRSAVVVKRLRDMQGAGKREFDRQMLVLGQLQHPNIVPLLAYYYAKDEKFLVIEHVGQGSLYSILHGIRGPDRTALGWDARLKVARGVARGMAYLHMAIKSQLTSSIVPHGNLKSSNILVDEGMVPKVADFGMVPLLTQSGAQCMAAFKAPEYAAKKTITPLADVYSFGIILLELLTGKPATSLQGGGGGVDVQKLVSSKQEVPASIQVYDPEVATMENEGEMEAMFKVAMMCIKREVEERPSMEDALRMVEAIQIVESPTTWVDIQNGHTTVMMESPCTNSFVSDYNTPTHSFSSHRSSFQHVVSPL